MDNTLNQLRARLAEVSDLFKASEVLGWDMQTYMPPGGGEARAEQIATLQKLGHEKFTHAEIGQWLEALKPSLQQLDSDSDDAGMIRVATRDYDRARKVPTELVAELARTTSMAHEVWAKARAEKNFSAFLPMLGKIIELKQRVSACFGPQDSPYDPLLDEYEPGMKTAQVRAVFAELKQDLVPLVKAIATKPEVDDGVLHKDYDEQMQWDFGVEVIKRFGYDFNHGRQDKSVHPFTTSFGSSDVRITTRLMRNFIPSALMGTMHECGHALYEQGVAPELNRTPLADGTSLGVHESQSRMWENLVGRSRDFWKFFYPQLQAVFPENLRGVDLDIFYKALNKVKPSLIRVEADEVTYNLHTLLRFELEVDLMENRLKAKDLPAAWNAKVKEYLGLDVPDDSQGVLQDVHWSAGYIGYFPTYTLGNILSVQFFEKAIQAVPSIPADIEHGEFGGLLGWLRENIHRHGRKYTPNELIQRVTGEPLNAKPYLAYLKRKYQALYGIKDEELRS